METGKSKVGTFCVGKSKKEELQSADSLLIESEIDNLSIAIIDKKASQCVGLCSIPLDLKHRREDLKNILSNDAILNFPFSKRNILMANRECVFIPEEIYEESKNDYYIQSSFGENYEGICFSNKLAELANYIVYKVPQWLIIEYEDHLSGASIQHSTALLVESIFRLSKQSSELIVHAHFRRTFFELVVFKKGKMLFYNSFAYQTSEDIAYFIMYAFAQWEFEANSMFVSGVLDQNSDELYWLRKYLKEINTFPDQFLMAYPAALESPSNFINLLNPSLCE